MNVAELLYRIAQRGVTLSCGSTEDRLHYAPAGALPSELVTELKKRKQEVIQTLREDEEYRQTGIIQCERQVFDLVREHFGVDKHERTT
jgi:hypothetical protein